MQKIREYMNNKIKIDKLFKIKISKCLIMQILYYKSSYNKELF